MPIYIPPELNPEGLSREDWMQRAEDARIRREAAERQRERDLYRYARWQALGTMAALVVAVVALIVALAK